MIKVLWFFLIFAGCITLMFLGCAGILWLEVYWDEVKRWFKRWRRNWLKL